MTHGSRRWQAAIIAVTRQAEDHQRYAPHQAPTVPRRSSRQPRSPRHGRCRPHQFRRRQDRRRQTARDRGRSDPRGCRQAGVDRPRRRDRWRVPPRHLFGQLHHRRHRRHQCRVDRAGGVEQIRHPRPSHRAARIPRVVRLRQDRVAREPKTPKTSRASPSPASKPRRRRSPCPARPMSTTVPGARISIRKPTPSSTSSGPIS